MKEQKIPKRRQWCLLGLFILLLAVVVVWKKWTEEKDYLIYRAELTRGTAKEHLRILGDAVELFRDKHGHLPSAEEFNSPLLYDHLKGGKEDLTDPYGSRIRYCQDEMNIRGFNIASSGPDGVPDTKDDIYLSTPIKR